MTTMKNEYKAPSCNVVQLQLGETILATSNIPVGGSTDHFDSRKMQSPAGDCDEQEAGGSYWDD